MYLSYIGILVIPILAGVVIYGFALKITKEQTDRMNDNLLTMVQRELDYKIEEVIKVTSRVAVDSKVREASAVKNRFKPEDQYLLYSLVQDLNNINLSEKLVKDVFVYFNNTQTVSSMKGNMSAELYYQLYYKNSKYSFDDFRDYMSQSHFSDTLNLTKDDGEKMLLFTMSDLDFAMWGEPSSTIGAAMNMTALKQTMESMLWDEKMILLILNSDDQIINKTEGVPGDLHLKYDELPEGNYVDRKLLEEPYAVSVRKSETIEWKYVMLIPESLIQKSARDIQKYAVLGLFVCIISGFLCSYYLTKRNYHPLKNILELFMGNGVPKLEKGENEFQWLRSQSEHFFKERMDTQLLLADSRKNLKLYHLLKLLEYPYDTKKMQEVMDHYHIHLGAGHHMVIIFSVGSDRGKEAREDESVEENALHKFIISNVFEEMVLDCFNIEILEIGDRVAAIVEIPENRQEYMDKIMEMIGGLQQMAQEQFGFSIIALTGDSHPGLEGIHLSYTEACEIGEYVELLDTDLIVYSDVKNAQKKYNYSMDTEQRIINAIKTGQASAAVQYIDQAFDDNFSETLSIDVCRCLIYDMMGTLLKGADEGGYHNFAEDFEFSSELSARLPLSELKRRFGGIAGKICDKILIMQKEAGDDKKLSKKVQDYIQDNYQDPDLNISLAGQHFEMTPAYLSSIYKKQTGESLLEYINKVRISEAEQLLATEHSVVEVAQMVGFRDSGSFIRVFKKRMGVTPGQLKKKS